MKKGHQRICHADGPFLMAVARCSVFPSGMRFPGKPLFTAGAGIPERAAAFRRPVRGFPSVRFHDLECAVVVCRNLQRDDAVRVAGDVLFAAPDHHAQHVGNVL